MRLSAVALVFLGMAWSGVAVADPGAPLPQGYLGPHARQSAAAPDVLPLPPVPAPLPDVTPGPDKVVYGYQAYWNADLNAVPWDHLSHIAIFAASVDSTGTLSSTSRWDITPDAVAIAEPYGVRVHLCVTNFSTSSLRTLLGSTTAQDKLVASLETWVANTGAHGVNIDFEGLPSDRKTEMVAFTARLAGEFDEVVLASPAVDWSGAWDYSELTKYADLFIMGYAYHYSGSSSAGPNDPLYGGGVWSSISLSATVDDYLTNGADPDRVILGLPLYGNYWQTNGSDSVPAATVSGTDAVVLYSSSAAKFASYGRRYDQQSHTPYYFDGTGQGWIGDTDSLRERVQMANEAGIAGIGFWALHYDGGDAEMWEMLRQETTLDGPDTPEPSAFQADAGSPFLAYEGDTVVLSGQWSTGPIDPLQYRWTQVAGPEVELDDPSLEQPSFRVTDTGTLVFELEVGDGEVWSTPARSYVVVIDPREGRRFVGCAHVPPWTLVAWPLLLVAGLVRRRR